jgi:two-component system alkaline phosphatase synthesis response regulator PhoP
VTTLLVVEDDRQIRKVVEAYLAQAGFDVRATGDGPEALMLAQSIKPALIVLDLMLPGMDGMEIARRLRASHDPALAGVYIVMLTARVEETERVAGLEIGADDYVVKPFSPRELVARVQAAIRRLEQQPETRSAAVLESNGLRLDPHYRTVILHGAAIELTSTEFDLLCHLMRHPGQPFRRSQLLDVIEQPVSADATYERTVDAHIKNLRQKLGGAGRQSRFIETVHGLGYRFVRRGQ